MKTTLGEYMTLNTPLLTKEEVDEFLSLYTNLPQQGEWILHDSDSCFISLHHHIDPTAEVVVRRGPRKINRTKNCLRCNKPINKGDIYVTCTRWEDSDHTKTPIEYRTYCTECWDDAMSQHQEEHEEDKADR